MTFLFAVLPDAIVRLQFRVLLEEGIKIDAFSLHHVGNQHVLGTISGHYF